MVKLCKYFRRLYLAIYTHLQFLKIKKLGTIQIFFVLNEFLTAPFFVF